MNEMNCNICQYWLNGYADNELDTTTATLVADHLIHCADCRRRYEEIKRLSTDIKAHAPYFDAPAVLTRSIFATIEKENRPESHTSLQKTLREWFTPAFSAIALALALSLYVNTPSGSDLWIDETVSSHVRSLMEHHLTDVESSDRHTVKPWFTGKIDFSPPVYDFAAQGYPLIGGRLDYMEHQTVAVLVYRHNKHIINVFILPVTDADYAPQTLSSRGYNMVVWRKNHMAFRAISDLNTNELKALSQLIIKDNI